MKTIKLLTALLLLPAYLSAQKDTVKVTYEYKQEVINGKQTPKNWVINQTVRDLNDKLLREYYFNDSTRVLSYYVWYFYKDSKLFTKESYSNKDSLISLIKYSYDNFGNETEEAVFKNSGKMISEFQKNIYNYSDGKKLSCKQYNKDNKINASARYYYNLKGKPTKESFKYKSRSGSELKSELITFSYDDNDLLTQEIHQRKYRNGNKEEINVTYSYNDEEQLIRKEEKNTDGKLLKYMEYKYYPHGNLNIYWEYSGDGKLLNLLSYKYEIHAITPGTFRSYLDREEENK